MPHGLRVMQRARYASEAAADANTKSARRTRADMAAKERSIFLARQAVQARRETSRIRQRWRVAAPKACSTRPRDPPLRREAAVPVWGGL